METELITAREAMEITTYNNTPRGEFERHIKRINKFINESSLRGECGIDYKLSDTSKIATDMISQELINKGYNVQYEFSFLYISWVK